MLQASMKQGKKKERKAIFVWNDQEKMDHGIDPIIWGSWNEKWNAAGRPDVSDFYQVPVEHGGPTTLEMASHLRTFQQWTAEAYDKKREGTRHLNRYHITYPPGQCVSSPKMRKSPAMRWENGSYKIAKDEDARLESPARPRNEALINRNDPEYADLVAEESDCDLADEFGDLCVVEHSVAGEDDVPIDEPLAIVDPAFMQRSNPAALMMDSHLPIRDRRQTVLLCVAEYEGRMRMKAEQAVAELNAKLEAKTVYKLMTNDGTADDEYNEYVAQLQWENWHLEKELVPSLDEEIKELKQEVTRLNGLFRDVSLLARDAFGAICDRFNV